jgi:PAS domain S-box-containing protein
MSQNIELDKKLIIGRYKLASILAQAPGAIAVFDGPDHVFQLTNHNYLSLFFGDRDDLIGRPVREAVPEAVEQGFVALLDGVYQTGEPYSGTEAPIDLKQSDGTIKSFYINFVYQPLRNTDGVIEGIIAVVIDATSQVLTKQALEISAKELVYERHKLETIFKESPSGMALFSGENLVFEKVNPTCKEIFHNRELIGKPLVDAFPELINTALPELVKGVMKTGEPFVRKEALAKIAKVIGGPTEDRYFDFSCLRINDADGKPYGVYNHFIEVTERVLAHRLLEKSIQNLAEERELRENFVMTLTHDLRTPLTAARMSAELLMRNSNDPLKRQKIASMIVKSIDRANRMISDLLDVCQIKAGSKISLNIEACNLNEITQSTLDDLISIHGDRFRLNSNEQIHGYWECTAIRRIIENLLGNAVKYGAPKALITIGLKQKMETIEISVHNEGNVIPPEDQILLFRLFQRAESARQGSDKGWGIGLTLVQGLVEAHGGSVLVKSEVSEGTTFIVELPINARR